MDDLKKNGFERGYEPHSILGAKRMDNGELMFLMRWKQINEPDLIQAEIANIQCPQLVIEFYEKNLVFVNKNCK